MQINSSFFKIIEEKSRIPFQYGVNDCALFVVSIYKEAFGLDITNGVLPTYNDKLGSIKMYLRCGGWDGLLLKEGFVKIDVKQAHRGDIVISVDGAAGIMLGTKSVFAGGAYREINDLECAYAYKEKL